MNREECLDWLCRLRSEIYVYMPKEWIIPMNNALDMVIKELEQKPCEDAISRSDAIRVASGYCHWSNIPDELAKLPSVNPIPCEDAISRQAVLEGLASIAKAKAKSDAQKSMMGRAMFFVERLPSVSVKEKTGRCKNCKWWKDSDGAYRRGSRAESQCPINRKEVFEGNGYCYMYEPQERSNKVYCVMSGEARTDLDNVVYASTSKADAEMFAYKDEFYDYSGNPYIEVLDVVESEDNG